MSSLLASLWITVSSTFTARIDARREDGLETVEYALIAALIAVVLIATVTTLGTTIRTTFNTIISAMGGTPPTP